MVKAAAAAASASAQQPPPPQKAIFARLSYIHQAATVLAAPQFPASAPSAVPATTVKTNDVITSDKHLQTQAQPQSDTPLLQQPPQQEQEQKQILSSSSTAVVNTLPTSRFLLSSLLSTSRKSVLRLSPSVKRTICKRCTSLLIPSLSATTRLENGSKHRKKVWADILRVECQKCGAVRRFPVGLNRGIKRGVKTELNGNEEEKDRSKDVKKEKDILGGVISLNASGGEKDTSEDISMNMEVCDDNDDYDDNGEENLSTHVNRNKKSGKEKKRRKEERKKWRKMNKITVAVSVSGDGK